MLFKFEMLDNDDAVVAGTPTVTVDGVAATPTDLTYAWGVEVAAGSYFKATLEGARTIALQMPYADGAAIKERTDNLPDDPAAVDDVSVTVPASTFSGTVEVPQSGIDEIAAAAQAGAASATVVAPTDPPAGYTRYTIAPGTLLPGTVIDAYLPDDTAYATPQVDNAVIGSNGGGFIDLPDDGEYTLVGRLTGKENAILEGVTT